MRTLCATILAAIVTHCKSVVIAATCGVAAVADTVWIEAESFEDCGGWVNDTQFMDQMGSPYLLAHGLGKPVSDAKTKFVAKGGRYNVWVRTKNWTSFWHPDIGAGTFNLVINGEKLPNLLGCQGKGEWLWVKADDVTLKDGENTLALHDRDGFDGRVDAIVFTTEANPLAFLDNPRRPSCVPAIKNLNIPRYDVVVVGGGVAGICAAISSARLGLRTALVHDRPILGGNNSSEVRVHLGAYANIPPYPRLGDVLAEFGPRRIGNAEPASNYEDDLKMKVVKQTKGLDLYLNQHVNGVVTNCEGRITAVTAQDTRKGGLQNFEGSWFVDCTGDGNLGFLAGADYRMGREAKVETNEPDAPEKADMVTMGASVQWYAGSRGMGNGNDFPVRPWMLKTINEGNCSPHLKGDWWWEAGLGRDQIKEGEYIRDYGLLVAFSNWAFVKNCYSKKDSFAEKELKWVAYNAGRRESRRLLGDFILDQNHLRNKDFQPDGTCATTWTIDLHLPKTAAESKFDGEPYQSNSLNERIWPYPIPYRCLYSRNVPNLFMAGRDISVTHIALGTTRLMRTHGMMGEVVGMAAAVCKKHGCDPREVYTKHFGDLKALMEKGVGDGNKHPRQDYNCQSSLDPDIRKKHAESVKGRVAFEQETKKECFSGIYPHLAMFNDEGECGVGAVVPWAGDLWVVTYGPHCPLGSSDKLYRIKPDLTRETFPGSVGGTPANRMIHRETNQLLIGPYVIDAKGNVRVIPPMKMPGRLTANARHLADPAHKAYYATMEAALFEVNLETLEVTALIQDDGINKGYFDKAFNRGNAPKGWFDAPVAKLPGYHGKGMMNGFGKLFYANNGEHSPEAKTNPFIQAGALGWWDKPGEDWHLVRRTQFTEVTSPDGIYGNEHPETNPVWTLGWDAKSVILGVTTNGAEWAYYRLPKASHAYDGAHGWNTEWPRIRDVGFGDGTFLATMHGTFWKFPKGFSPANPNGIRPISTYLKVIGDFCRWGDRIVFGCDDQAKSEFLGKRGLKKDAPRCERSQSNLWFVKPEELKSFGSPSGEGYVWLNEDVKAGDVSDPYLHAGYETMKFSFTSAAGTPVRHELLEDGDWVRVKCQEDAKGAVARFAYGPARCEIPQLDGKNPVVTVTDDNGKVWRFPNVNGDTNVVCREIATERDLLYVGGVWYEVPAENAGGFSALRPIALADEPVRTLEGRLGLMYVNGRAMVIDDLWKNGTSAVAYWLWKRQSGMESEAK